MDLLLLTIPIDAKGVNTMSNGFIISKDTWDHMPENQRDWILFDTMQSLTMEVKILKRWNRVFSFAGGIVGGAATALGIKVGS